MHKLIVRIFLIYTISNLNEDINSWLSDLQDQGKISQLKISLLSDDRGATTHALATLYFTPSPKPNKAKEGK